MIQIRQYNPLHDEQVLKNLLLELLDFEKQVEPEWPSGAEIIGPYFDWMMKRCLEQSGRIFMADEDGRVLGFVTVLGRVLPPDPDEYPRPYAFISELIVNSDHRGRGLGKMLITQAETYASEMGVAAIRLEASAGNSRGRSFYSRTGYRELVVELFKKLD
jgi:ribosomal protein S18 acetylase RimI-like enzyme